MKLGAAVTIRQQQGAKLSSRVGSSSLGLGVTGGFMVPIDRDHQVGLSLRHLYLGNADPQKPVLVLGATRHHKGYLNMFLDMEYSSGGLFRFHPGLEWMFARGVLRPRLGYGGGDSGISHMSTGFGVYLSPVQLDVAYAIPLKTLNDSSGEIRASFNYRFGRPQFSEIYYDRALEEASQLDNKVLNMTVKEAELKSSLDELNQKRRLAGGELENIKSRIEALKSSDLLGQRDESIRELKARLREIEDQLGSQRSQVKQLREQKATIRVHAVVAGETLQSIAKEYYGDPNQWKKIYSANVDKIDRGLPRPGEKLVIP